jgi:hypothetical protein
MEAEQVDERLAALEKSVAELRAQIADSIMTEEDYEALRRYRRTKQQGKLIPHAAVKEQLGL